MGYKSEVENVKFLFQGHFRVMNLKSSKIISQLRRKINKQSMIKLHCGQFRRHFRGHNYRGHNQVIVKILSLLRHYYVIIVEGFYST